MKKKYTLQRTLLFLCFLLSFISCKKDILTEKDPLQQAKDWYTKTVEKGNLELQSTNGSSSTIRENVQWTNACIYTLNNGTELITAPIIIAPTNGRVLSGSAIVLISQQNGKYNFTIAYNPDKEYFLKTFLSTEIQEIYTSTIKANANHKTKNPILNSRKAVMDAPEPGGECIDWYLQVTIRDANGNVIDFYENYLYTSCTGGEIGEGGGDYGDPREGEVQAFEDDYKSRMSHAELLIYNNMSRYNQLSYLVNAQTASNAAILRFPGMEQGDTKADAFRHAYFSILNVYELGLTLATNLGNAHEELTNQSPLAKQMDLFNNNVGRSAYVYYSPETPYWERYSNLIYTLITNGSLRYISDGQLKPTNQ
jgi:hypothetical protein